MQHVHQPFAATVSQEWQTLIEQHNFARIRVTPARLDHLESYITAPRQAYVHYIWLCVELEAYDCRKCAPEDPYKYAISDTDHRLITATLGTLFGTLSQWRPNGDLMLDISIHSISNSGRSYDSLTVTQDAPMESAAVAQLEDGGFFLSDVFRYSSERIMDRVFKPVISEGQLEAGEEEIQWWQGLPSVPAVTTILLRQQNYRRWNARALAQMFAHFPQLQEIHYEPWGEWDRDEQTVADQGYDSLLESVGGGTHPNLRKLVMFENFPQQYLYNIGSAVPCEPVRTPTPAVAHKVARKSLGLHHFSASFIVEASHFFGHLKPSWMRPNLTSLVLTSQLLIPNPNSPSDVDDLLESAANAAMKMPKLQSMEIWNGDEGVAGTFQYRSAPPSITWRGTWAHLFLPSVVQAWQAVVTMNTCHGDNTEPLVVVNEALNERLITKSHGEAIYHLKVSPSVIRPVSLQQIQLKDRSREEYLRLMSRGADIRRRTQPGCP